MSETTLQPWVAGHPITVTIEDDFVDIAIGAEGNQRDVVFQRTDPARLVLAQAIAGDGYRVIERARADRLIELAAALDDLGDIDFDEWPPQWDNEIDRLTRAREAMECADFAPLGMEDQG